MPIGNWSLGSSTLGTVILNFKRRTPLEKNREIWETIIWDLRQYIWDLRAIRGLETDPEAKKDNFEEREQ